MKKFIVVLLCSLASTALADVLVMKNGDRITGTVVKKEGSKVTVKTANFGEVAITWDDVVSVTTETPLTVETAGGQQLQGPLNTANGRVTVGGQAIALGDVVAARDAGSQASFERLLNPGWAELWTGTASISWAGTSGNAQTNTFAIGSNAARTTRTDKTTIYFNAIKASALVGATKQTTAQAVRGGWAYNRDLNSRIFFTGFNDWEFDQFQSLDLRSVFGAGAGYKLARTENTKLDLVGGIAYNRSKFDPPAAAKFTRNDAEAYWGNDFSHKLGTRTSVTQKFRMFNNLTNSGEYRMNFDVGATTEVFRWLSWNLSFSDRYLSNPAPGRKTNDVLYTTGFGVNF